MFGANWPQLTDDNYRITSGQTPNYNCVAFSIYIEHAYIWPDEDCQYMWPQSVPRTASLDAFTSFYELMGYRECRDWGLERGYEKIAIYCDGDAIEHVARQLQNGKWTSKLGDLVDIEHTDPRDLAGGIYGRVMRVMKRVYDGSPPAAPEMFPKPSITTQ